MVEIPTRMTAEEWDRMLSGMQAAQSREPLRPQPEPTADALEWPPGFAGHLARYICDTSYQPVPEVATTAALALLAGVCGRAYRTYTKADLALYLILVAKTGVGKDGIHEGVPKLLEKASKPDAAKVAFLRNSEFVSGQALHLALLETPGFLNLQGEFGKKLKRMTNPNDTHMQHFKTVMLNAYNKTYFEGRSSVNSDTSRPSVRYPALSFLGETTPGTFLGALTTDMMEDGFLSRFLVIFCASDKPEEPNPEFAREAELDDYALDYWRKLVDHALSYWAMEDPKRIPVAPAHDAREQLERIRKGFDAELRKLDDDGERHLWTRAHLTVLKVASLLAVADNFAIPTVRLEHVEWAEKLVLACINRFKQHNLAGDVGSDDDARERKVLAILRDYVLNPVPASYGLPDAMRENMIVPHRWLQLRTHRTAGFRDHKLGSARALDDTIRGLIAGSYLMEVAKDKLAAGYNYHGKGYRILKASRQ